MHPPPPPRRPSIGPSGKHLRVNQANITQHGQTGSPREVTRRLTRRLPHTASMSVSITFDAPKCDKTWPSNPHPAPSSSHFFLFLNRKSSLSDQHGAEICLRFVEPKYRNSRSKMYPLIGNLEGFFSSNLEHNYRESRATCIMCMFYNASRKFLGGNYFSAPPTMATRCGQPHQCSVGICKSFSNLEIEGRLRIGISKMAQKNLHLTVNVNAAPLSYPSSHTSAHSNPWISTKTFFSFPGATGVLGFLFLVSS